MVDLVETLSRDMYLLNADDSNYLDHAQKMRNVFRNGPLIAPQFLQILFPSWHFESKVFDIYLTLSE